MGRKSDKSLKREWRPPKPLWSFGPRGWVLLPVAIGLAVVLFSGIDGRYHVLRAIQWSFGTDAMLWFVTVGLPFHAADAGMPPFGLPPGARFGLVTLCLTLVAMAVHPKWFSGWVYLAVVALGFLAPPMQVQLSSWISRALAPGATLGEWQRLVALAVAGIMVMIATATVLWIVSRSRPVLFFAVVTGIIAAWLRAESWSDGWLLGPSAVPLALLLDWAWNPALFGLLLWWAVQARRRWKPPWACTVCGYDLRGSLGGPCPECGPARTDSPGHSREAD